MTDGGPQQLPPAHRAARLAILVALVGVLVAGLLAAGLTDAVGAAWQWGVDAFVALLTALRDGARA
ncbi:hypothetical protein C5N14_26815 [Micromonospora sp. MW-13]|uniref:hypothetical protein n=1 Tax=Micromonospora sp. MW-13 TaxID=2094022 RepID=UPI000E451179|nr:hypothetical protein [Micromonospora sp. MW-13]RGC65766.1 hypothetical protein C5N14_26815 [Micromonospora sp. MW-13]